MNRYNSKMLDTGRFFLIRNKYLFFLTTAHLIFSFGLGKLFVLAPDENAYLFTFDNIYSNASSNPQFSSGWITTPQIFLWIALAPAKLLATLGIPSISAIRMESILLITISYVLLRHIVDNRTSDRRYTLLLNFSFSIPSVFLWTSLGLRESFIVFAFSLFSFSLSKYIEMNKSYYLVLLFISGYSLLSIKNYLFFVFAIAVLISLSISIVTHIDARKFLLITVSFLLIPLCAYWATSTPYAFEFMYKSILKGDISETSQRSGESITKVPIPSSLGSTPGNSVGNTPGDTPGDTPEYVTLRGDYTLITTYDFLRSPGNDLLKSLLNVVGVTKVVNYEYQNKVKEALLDKQLDSKPIGVIQPANLSSLVSILVATSYFVLGPFPPDLDKGLFGYLISFEAPLWWILVIFVFITIKRDFRKNDFKNSSLQLHSILLLGLLLMSALIEVNLGTSFRHKSILIVPLIALVFSLAKNDSSKSHKE